MTALNQNQKMTDYKKYSLEQLDNWIHDVISCSEASPQEIYDVIYDAVKENYYHHKHHVSRAYELMCLMNGNGNSIIPQKDKVKKWVLPVQCTDYYDVDSYYVNVPDDLLQAIGLKEGDQIEWIDNGDGSFTLRKV